MGRETLHTIIVGKFQGVMEATTPNGCGMEILRESGEFNEVSPSAISTRPAK